MADSARPPKLVRATLKEHPCPSSVEEIVAEIEAVRAGSRPFTAWTPLRAFLTKRNDWSSNFLSLAP